MSDYSEDLKENDNLKNSDSESEDADGNFQFFDKILLFQSSSNQISNIKTKNNTFLPLPSKSIDVNVDTKMKMITADTSDKSDVNIFLNEDQSYMENKATLNVNKNYSPKKKRSPLNILGQEKTKTPNKKISVFQKIKQKDSEKAERKDNNGIVINKKNKRKVKITFNDPFEDVVYIESFKKFNVIVGQPKKDIFIKQHDECRCCCIW